MSIPVQIAGQVPDQPPDQLPEPVQSESPNHSIRAPAGGSALTGAHPAPSAHPARGGRFAAAHGGGGAVSAHLCAAAVPDSLREHGAHLAGGRFSAGEQADLRARREAGQPEPVADALPRGGARRYRRLPPCAAAVPGQARGGHSGRPHPHRGRARDGERGLPLPEPYAAFEPAAPNPFRDNFPATCTPTPTSIPTGGGSCRASRATANWWCPRASTLCSATIAITARIRASGDLCRARRLWPGRW